MTSKVNNPPTISHAITRLVVLLTLSLTVIYSLLILLYSWLIEDNIFNRLVAREALFIQQQFQQSGEIPAPRNDFMSLHENWRGLPDYMQAQHQRDPNRIEFDGINGGTVHIQLFTLANRQYVLAADVARYEVSRDYLFGALIWLVALSLICCLLVAMLAVRRGRQITRPLNQLATEVGGTPTPNDISKNYPNNEIGFLAERIRNAFEHLNRALKRESNFTKDISHEIRTPITVLNNVLSQVNGGHIADSQLHQLKQAQYQLEQTTSTLLALARDESSQKQTVNINALLEDCLLSNWEVNHTEKGQQIEFELNTNQDQDICKKANRHLIEILFNNALSNMVHYTAGQRVIIAVNENSIRFTNTHSGVLPQDLFTEGNRSEHSTGIGQGLSLIKRIAVQTGWEASVRTTDSEFSLIIQFSSQVLDT